MRNRVREEVQEREALERGLREALRLMSVTLDDMTSALERLRQLRQAAAGSVSDHRLVVHEGPNGRPEVVR